MHPDPDASKLQSVLTLEPKWAKKYFKTSKFWIVQVKKASHTTFFTSGLPSKFDHQLYKDEISYDLGFIAIGVVMAT